jgi:hypothetical protein
MIRSERLIYARRNREAELENHQRTLTTLRDLEFKAKFLERDPQYAPREVKITDEPESLLQRREKLRTVYKQDERNWDEILEERFKESWEDERKMNKEREIRVQEKLESERRKLVQEKLDQRELEQSIDARAAKLRGMYQEQRISLDLQREEKKNRIVKEEETNLFFDQIWAEEYKKKEERERRDEEAIRRRNEETRRRLDEQLEEKRHQSESNECDFSFPDNCFWNGTLHSTASNKTRVVPELSAVDSKQTKRAAIQAEREENQCLLREQMERDRMQADNERQLKEKQKIVMKQFFDEHLAEKVEKRKQQIEVDEFIAASCTRAIEAQEREHQKDKERRDALLRDTMHGRSQQLSEQKSRAEIEEIERERERIEVEQRTALLDLEEQEKNRKASEKARRYKDTLLAQISERRKLN